MMYKIKTLSGFHIPFEYCDKCKNRCERYGSKPSKKMEEVNKRREEIAKYLKQMGVPVHTYASPADMRCSLEIMLTMFSEEYIEPLNELIFHLNLGRDKGKKLMMITILYNDIESKWYEELKNKGKISPILKMMK